MIRLRGDDGERLRQGCGEGHIILLHRVCRRRVDRHLVEVPRYGEAVHADGHLSQIERREHLRGVDEENARRGQMITGAAVERGGQSRDEGRAADADRHGPAAVALRQIDPVDLSAHGHRLQRKHSTGAGRQGGGINQDVVRPAGQARHVKLLARVPRDGGLGVEREARRRRVLRR